MTWNVETIGKLAYEAYGLCRDWKTVSGTPMPSWDDQSPELREAWRMAADAVAMFVTTDV